MRGLVPAESPGQIIFDFLLGIAAILVAELHADAGGALTLSAFGSHPDHASGDGQLFFLSHEVQKHEHLIAQPVITVGWNEQPAILYEGHIGEVERALVLDGKRQQTRFIAWTSQIPTIPAMTSLAQCASAAHQQCFNCQLLIHAGRGKTPELPRSVQQLE